MVEFVTRSSSSATAASAAPNFLPDGTAPPARNLPLNGKTAIVIWPPIWPLNPTKPRQKLTRSKLPNAKADRGRFTAPEICVDGTVVASFYRRL